jgi:hypothetical protein
MALKLERVGGFFEPVVMTLPVDGMGRVCAHGDQYKECRDRFAHHGTKWAMGDSKARTEGRPSGELARINRIVRNLAPSTRKLKVWNKILCYGFF